LGAGGFIFSSAGFCVFSGVIFWPDNGGFCSSADFLTGAIFLGATLVFWAASCGEVVGFSVSACGLA